MTGKGKDILAVRRGEGPEGRRAGGEKTRQGAQGLGQVGAVSQKGLHSRDLGGPQGGRRGSLLRPDAPKLQERKIRVRGWGTRRMKFPGREGPIDSPK